MNTAITTRMHDMAIRDIPTSCVCGWQFNPSYGGRYIRTRHIDDCPWHARPGVYEQKRKGVAA